MGEAKAKERRVKDLTLAELRAETTGALEDFASQRLVGLIDGVVKQRIGEYHAMLVERGLLREPEKEDDAGKVKLWTPS